MAGPGGGPPRRSHTKSRKGCETCKRRHIRCDESFPQCRNCTKHKIRCPYNEVQAPGADRPTTPERPDLMWTPQIEAAITEWQASGRPPFPTLQALGPMVSHQYSVEDLRLIYHVANLYQQLSAIDANNFTLWTRHIPALLRIGATSPYVMHALLAFSAMHIAFLTDCPMVGGMAFEHRGNALIGLHEAINTFSRETSDAILAASLVLSWQATDWRSWTQLMQGTATVIDAMDAWKHESQFGDFIAESSTFPTAPASPGSDYRSTPPREEDFEAFQKTLEQLQKLESHLKHHKEETTQVQHLIGFLKGSRKISPTLPIAQQYERLQPLRTWLFWMPVGYLQNLHGSANSLVIIAHLYTVALFMERFFPEIGAAYFGSLCITPIEEIARRLMSISLAGGAEAGARRETLLTLMEHPINIVGEFRSRMGWVHPERTPSFPQFGPPNFPVKEEYSIPIKAEYSVPVKEEYSVPVKEEYSMTAGAPSPHLVSGGKFSFSYSSDEMPMLNSASNPGSYSHSASPMMVSSPFAGQQYLGVPSPSYASAYSPASSTFEGSMTCSDADDYASCNLRGSPIYLTSGQSCTMNEAQGSYDTGFVTPHQPLWT